MFFTVLAAAAFTGCSNDDSDDGGTSGIPSITVNGANSTSVAVKLDGGDTPEVQIVSSGNWTLSVEGLNGAVASDCTPSLTSGGKGTATVKFNVKSATEDRTFVATVTTTGKIPGVNYETSVSAKITINQTNALYMENCGTDVEKGTSGWPDVRDYAGWSKGGMLDQSGVSYGGSSASVANSGKLFDPTEAEQAVVSGAPYASMNSATAKFYINDVNIGTSSNFTFTFTTIQQVDYSGGSVFGAVTDKTIRFAVSVDGGTEFMPAAYTVDQIAKGNWYLCTAEFKLPAGTSTDKLSFRFDNYAYSANHGLRLDDFKLVEGGNGSELAPAQTTTVTISEITEVGTAYEVEGATVVGTYQQGFVMQDETGAILAYMGSKAENIPAEGSVVTVSGEGAKYGDAMQLGSTKVVSSAAGTMPTLTPTAVTADNIAGMMKAPVATYVKMTGTLDVSKSGSNTYYNVNFLFTGSGYTGSISYPNESLNVESFDGKIVDVEGWFVNNGSSKGGGKYFTVVARSIEENTTAATGSFTTTPTTFAATDPQPQVLNFTASASAGTVKFEITGTNAEKFTYSDQTASTVKVSAVGNNESDAAYTAVLTLKSEADDVLASVNLKQAGVSSGNDTKGTYTSMPGMLPDKTNSDQGYYAEKATINGTADIPVLKFGTGSKCGVFETAAVGVSGNKKLSFYAAAWKGESTTIYIRVNNGGSVSPASAELTANTGVSGSQPYTITFSDDTDYYTFDLTDLTEASTLTFSTSPDFVVKGKGRAVMAGIQIY